MNVIVYWHKFIILQKLLQTVRIMFVLQFIKFNVFNEAVQLHLGEVFKSAGINYQRNNDPNKKVKRISPMPTNIRVILLY